MTPWHIGIESVTSQALLVVWLWIGRLDIEGMRLFISMSTVDPGETAENKALPWSRFFLATRLGPTSSLVLGSTRLGDACLKWVF